MRHLMSMRFNKSPENVKKWIEKSVVDVSSSGSTDIILISLDVKTKILLLNVISAQFLMNFQPQLI